MMDEHARQSTCVAIGGRGVLIEGRPGTGKSSLALALIDRGAVLVGDDGVLVRPVSGRLVARPHPNTRGLIEVRNLGLLAFPVLEEVAIALCLRLGEFAPRFIETAGAIDIAGVTIPAIDLTPADWTLPFKAELALDRYGLDP